MLGNLIHLTYCISVSITPFPSFPSLLSKPVPIISHQSTLQPITSGGGSCVPSIEQGALLRIFVGGGGVSFFVATMHTHTHTYTVLTSQRTNHESKSCATPLPPPKRNGYIWSTHTHTHCWNCSRIAVRQWEKKGKKGRKTNWWSKPNFFLSS